MSLKLLRRGRFYYLRGTVRGISVYESTGAVEKSVAETIRARRENEVLEESIFGRRATATFIEAAVSYMEAGGERRFVGPLIEHFGTTPLSQIDQAAIDRAATKLYANAAKSTHNRQVHTPVSAILRHASARGMCEQRQIERPRQPKGRVRWLTSEEAERLMAACAPHLQPLVTFLFYTGARMSEALYLDWQQVDLSRAEVQFVKTKNGEARGVPLAPRVVAILTRLSHRQGAVFRKPNGTAYALKTDGGGQIKTGFKAACRRARITDFSPHDCRHTWATMHYIANRDLAELMYLGGWNSEKMVLRYAHVNVSHLAASIGALPGAKSVQTDLQMTKVS